jgi:hypothetical protein
MLTRRVDLRLRRVEVCLGAARKAASLAAPALDRAPSPDGGTTELPERPRKAWTAHENVHSLRRDIKALRNIDSDHELGSRVELHVGKVLTMLI